MTTAGVLGLSAADGGRAQQPAQPPCGAAAHAQRFIDVVHVDGVRRSAIVNVGPHAADAPMPLVLAFHGAGASGRFMESYTGLSKIANRAGFIAVYPSAAGRLWNSAGRGDQPEDDVDFVRMLLDDLSQKVCVNEARVYATGVSNGGSFTARIGCELSDRLTAIAPVAGGYGVQPPCTPSRPVSVLEIHGTADGAVPYYGKPPDHRGSVPGFLAAWQRADGCTGSTGWERLAPKTLLRVRRGCAAGTTVAHVKLVGGGHVWPGALLGGGHAAAAGGLSATQAVWGFFSSRSVSRRAIVRRR